VDILFFLGRKAAVSLISWAITGQFGRAETARLAGDVLGTLIDEVGALRADLVQRLDRIEASLDHLVTAPARTAIGIGWRYLSEAQLVRASEDKQRAADRARESFVEAAESARVAMAVQPAMAGVAGEAELLIAATLLASGRLREVPSALSRAENAYKAGIDALTEQIVKITGERARDHFMSTASKVMRFRAAFSSDFIWWPAREELQSGPAKQLSELVSRFNRYRATVKAEVAAPEDCALIVPATSDLSHPHFEDPLRLELGINLQSLRLAWRPLHATSPLKLDGYSIRLPTPWPRLKEGGSRFDFEIDLMVTAPQGQAEHDLYWKDFYFEPLEGLAPGRETVATLAVSPLWNDVMSLATMRSTVRSLRPWSSLTGQPVSTVAYLPLEKPAIPGYRR
jgi:hypothetical protein